MNRTERLKKLDKLAKAAGVNLEGFEEVYEHDGKEGISASLLRKYVRPSKKGDVGKLNGRDTQP